MLSIRMCYLSFINVKVVGLGLSFSIVSAISTVNDMTKEIFIIGCEPGLNKQDNSNIEMF